MLTLPLGREGDDPRHTDVHAGYDSHTLALLGSLCLFLSAIEYIIPKPLPFMRIGLANLPLLLALNIFCVNDAKGGNTVAAGAKYFFLLALLKVLGQGLIGGTLFSYVFLFSCAGTFASAALMYLLRRLFSPKYLGFAGLGCAGAMASNGIQLVLARYLIFGPALRYLVPPFLVSGFVTGIALGLFCEYFCRHSRWYAQYTRYTAQIKKESTKRTCGTDTNDTNEADAYSRSFVAEENSSMNRWNALFPANQLFIGGLLMAVIFLFSPSLTGGSLAGLAAQFLFFCLLAWLAGRKPNLPATLVFMVGIVFFNLLAPYGKVIAALGPVRITEGSLFSGLEKALALGGLLMLSRACVKSDLRLPGIGALLGESFYMLEQLRAKKNRIKKGRITDIIAGIDQIMLEIGANPPQNTPQTRPQWGGKSLLFVSLMVIFTVALAFFVPQWANRLVIFLPVGYTFIKMY